MNLIVEIADWGGFWAANHKDAKGIKIGWIGLFWTRHCQIESAANWKRRYEKIEEENKKLNLAISNAAPAIEAMMAENKLLKDKLNAEEAEDDVDIDVLSQRRCSAAEQYAQAPREDKR